MKVSYQWLQEYLPVKATPAELADNESRTGLEVTDVKVPADGLKKIVVGHVLECVPHPNSDHLHICQVDIGEDEPTQIICGAPNVAAGQYVIVALPSARIAGNVKIKKGKMRGEASNGMLCALQEIGFPESVVPKEFVNGIYVFPNAETPGDSVFPLLGMDDAILDYDITPNRADCMSMRGVAWETGAMYNEVPTFKEPELTEGTTPIADLLTAAVNDEKDAPSYQLRVLQNVDIKPSPLWLQIRLWNAGIRPINNIVDVTNYIMLTYGQPMHAFDYDKLQSDKILVRRAHDGESLTTLDGNDHDLTEEDIVITDGTKPVALAGVMGGLATEITADTKNVVLESALFQPTLVRKTAQRYNLRSEASSRFEKGINTATINEALDAAAALMNQFAGGEVAQGHLSASSIEPLSVGIDISIDRINHVLGTALDVPTVLGIFKQLGFPTHESDGLFSVSIPPRRWDIHIDADLIEEVARIYGYDNLPSTLPTGDMTLGHLTRKQQEIRGTRRYLESAGLTEAISYSLTTAEKAQQFTLTDSALTKLDFPMTQDHAYLRQNLITGLLEDLAYNLARKQNDVAFYEQGRVFLKEDDATIRPDEVEYVAGAFTGLVRQRNWNQTKEAVDFYYAKGVVDGLLKQYHLAAPVRYEAVQKPEMHPGRTAAIYVGDVYVGFVGEVHPETAKAYEVKTTYVFELNLDLVLAQDRQKVVSQPTAKFPAVTRDVALQVAKEVTNEQIMDVITKNGGRFLTSVKLFDVYAGEKIAHGEKSLAYTLTYQNAKATLTEDEVNKAFAKVVDHLESDLDAKIR
ncbi:phenylalanyl-tRNA synthetase beta chain protein [Lactobacillus selangorensis]|uniref:Phenylalanine--tRNA ligase beta subunit n=1 Tax=Lactobacillus selangorensis TaxID=81857 RepID=A0A0R2FXS5_9LACO|nr:phenylalanine--tRNA ligase subunit beta [Lactobacillus selangorensis]KRN29716.1 phenylalanyl-tRNA synthetase beta chain protein [Lactobacillus selangorensis]KRN33755.1 phenylalanyl-tRNA synthetase beta chain protein [Lactobacillus selangorensis]